MTVYVDRLVQHDLSGKSATVRRVFAEGSCHLFTDSADLTELHEVAARVGMRRSWFQTDGAMPHYDLNLSRRESALAAGAVKADRFTTVECIRIHRAAKERKP